MGLLAMGPGSRSPLIERETKNAGGREWAFISKGTLEVQEGGGSSGGAYVLTMEYNGRPPIPARKNGRHTGGTPAKSERLHSTVTGTNFPQNLSQKIFARPNAEKILLPTFKFAAFVSTTSSLGEFDQNNTEKTHHWSLHALSTFTFFPPLSSLSSSPLDLGQMEPVKVGEDTCVSAPGAGSAPTACCCCCCVPPALPGCALGMCTVCRAVVQRAIVPLCSAVAKVGQSHGSQTNGAAHPAAVIRAIIINSVTDIGHALALEHWVLLAR